MIGGTNRQGWAVVGRRPVRDRNRGGRAHRPHLDALEARRVLNATCPTISGYVYHDRNNNGLYDAAEISPANAIAGSRIELYRGATLVGSTLTDANGFYTFDTDATVPTGVQTVRHEATLALTTTNFSRSLTLPQFDPALGTLVGVRVENGGRVQTRIRLENLSNARTITATVDATLTLANLPGTAPAVAAIPQVFRQYDAAAFDGDLDFAGPSGFDSGVISTAAAPAVVTVPAAAFAAFIGTGNLAPMQVAVATSGGTGPGNLVNVIQTQAEATAAVVYEYIPDNCLKPGDYVIRQAAQPAGTLDGQETRGNLAPLPNSAGGPDQIAVTLADADLPDNNFGELVAAALGDFAWRDLDGDGLQGGTEPGLANVPVALSGTDDLGAAVSRTAATGPDGKYRFDGLRPGSYRVTFGAVGGLAFTQANAGDDASDSDADPQTGATPLVALGSGQVNRTLDAGYVTAERLGSEGGTPGYWKNNAEKWGAVAWRPTGLSPSQAVSSVFRSVTGTRGSQTLLQALGNGGGGLDALLRQAVAGLLNALHPDVNYAIPSWDLVNRVNAAVAGANAATIDGLKTQLDTWNNRFHPLNQRGQRA
jgi:hypothetical protein